jgi:transcriptional regulator with XRE-family HTH domain
MVDDVTTFGARLSASRRSARLSQDELAERSGVSSRTIRNLERGRTRWPHPDSVRRLAEALELRDQTREDFIAAAGRRLAQTTMSDDPDTSAPVPADRLLQAGGEHVVPRQLPRSVRQFVGRQAELIALTSMLDHFGASTPTAAVISVIDGAPGVGKTALALHWAHMAAGDFPDGQLFVNLRVLIPPARRWLRPMRRAALRRPWELPLIDCRDRPRA